MSCIKHIYTKTYPPNISNKDYDTLVLSGGGKKGNIQLGFLYSYMKKMGNNFNFKTYIGTSVGSMICLLLCVGLLPIDIFKHECKTTHNPTDKMNLINLLTNFGLYSLDYSFDIISKVIEEKMGYIPTLKELYDYSKKELITVTHNLNLNSTIYISYKTHPDMSCIEAVRMSCNVPILFEKYYYNGNYYIDGGFSDNYPVEYACKLEETKNILGIQVGKIYEQKDDMDLLGYLKLLVKLTFKSKKEIYTHDKLDSIHIYIEDGKKEWDFSASTSEKLDFFSIGYNECVKIFGEEEITNEKDIHQLINGIIKVENKFLDLPEENVEKNVIETVKEKSD